MDYLKMDELALMNAIKVAEECAIELQQYEEELVYAKQMERRCNGNYLSYDDPVRVPAEQEIAGELIELLDALGMPVSGINWDGELSGVIDAIHREVLKVRGALEWVCKMTEFASQLPKSSQNAALSI